MPAYQPFNIQPKRILVITLRYLGDTLLVTPLLSSLKQAYPNAEIDVLLPKGNVGMLEGNVEINKLIPIVTKPSLVSFAKLLCGLYRRYDLSISTQAGDRPILCAIAAGKFSMGFVSENSRKDDWKRKLLSAALEVGGGQSHAVLENLRFCKSLNIEPCYHLTPPNSRMNEERTFLDEKYAVLHIMPQWRYKQWHADGWIKLVHFLTENGCRVVLTGSAQAVELEALNELQGRMPTSTLNLAGKLTLSQLTSLIVNAVVFVGPDTGITHMAAATGIPTVAIFGPTDPAKWAPWPTGYGVDMSPFESCGTKRIKNVYLVQGESRKGCVPCQLEGCERRRDSHSDCLDKLSAEKVINIVGTLL